jgi:PepSY-associated TM region
MQWARKAGTIHKWLALLMAIQILFWFVSGLFFAIFPIEQVRSEHRIAKTPPVPVSLSVASAGLQLMAASGVRPADKLELRSMLGRPVAVATQGKARPRLYDLVSGRRLSPLPAFLAAEIAERDHDGPQKARRLTLVTKESTEYRGALPAWRVDFDDGASRALYVAADTGAVTARRSTLWRTFDFLWGLHIMDFKEHQDFNTPLLIVATSLALIVIVTGMIMFPSRLGWHAWRRRRRNAPTP